MTKYIEIDGIGEVVPRSEYDALAAQVEALRKALNDQLNDCINFDGGKLTDAIMKHSSDLLAATPQQHLAEIRAQAVEYAADQLANLITAPPGLHSSAVVKLNRIADSIRQGEVK